MNPLWLIVAFVLGISIGMCIMAMFDDAAAAEEDY